MAQGKEYLEREFHLKEISFKNRFSNKILSLLESPHNAFSPLTTSTHIPGRRAEMVLSYMASQLTVGR